MSLVSLSTRQYLRAKDADADAAQMQWERAIAIAMRRWSSGEPCPRCRCWIGHDAGSNTRDPCPMIPQNVPLEEVRPNQLEVRRHWMCDRIRAATA